MGGLITPVASGFRKNRTLGLLEPDGFDKIGYRDTAAM
jgi:hypothetical protein